VGVLGSVTQFDDSDLQVGTSYEYRVVATNSAGDSEFSPELLVTTTITTTPGDVRFFAISQGPASSPTNDISLAWIPSSEFGYKLEVLDSSEGSRDWVEIASFDVGTVVPNVFDPFLPPAFVHWLYGIPGSIRTYQLIAFTDDYIQSTGAISALASQPELVIWSAVDLTFDGISETDEESVGGFVALNSNRDEGNFDGSGNPVSDNEPDATAGHRITGPSDKQLLRGELSIWGRYLHTSSVNLAGKYTLTFGNNIRVWILEILDPNINASEYVEVTSGEESLEIPYAAGPTKRRVFPILIEGVEESSALGDVELSAVFGLDFDSTFVQVK